MASRQPRSARDEEAVRRFVEHMALTFGDWGFPRMPARVLFAIMSAEEDALTAGELGERLAVSPAAISGALRYLMQIGIVVREPAPGSRRDVYRLPHGAWYEASAAKSGLFKTIADLSAEGVRALGGPGTRAGGRVAQMRDFFAFMTSEMETVLADWRAAKQSTRRRPARR